MMATRDIKAILAIIDLFHILDEILDSTKQSQTVSLHVGFTSTYNTFTKCNKNCMLKVRYKR